MRSHDNDNLTAEMPPNPHQTRAQLISAAEQLFAERGIEAVSLREINTAAGQRNATAVQYHFQDRDGLLVAVLAKHHAQVEQARHVLLDVYDSHQEATPGLGPEAMRELSGALVSPLAGKLADPDGGRSYLQIMAQLVNRPDPPWASLGMLGQHDSLNRWRATVAPLLGEAALKTLHHRFTAIRITLIELARRAEERPRRNDRLFVSHLTDLVSAILSAPMSAETAGLLEERARRQNP